MQLNNFFILIITNSNSKFGFESIYKWEIMKFKNQNISKQNVLHTFFEEFPKIVWHVNAFL